jgi:MFS family permease
MDDDLQTDPPRDGWYEWSLTAFYITYIAFEWMSLLWKLVPAHILVSVIVFTWGVVASLQAIAVSYPMLIALRLVLGIGEAGFTGIPFYLSFFFRRNELAFRTAIFMSGILKVHNEARIDKVQLLTLASRPPRHELRFHFGLGHR